MTVVGQQSPKTLVNGFYVIQDSGKVKNSDCIFCNPSSMPDRIVLDSNYRMVARKVSHPMGYTYYEWRNKENTKTYEEIHLYNYRKSTYYSDSGSFSSPEKNTFISSHVGYSMAQKNNKQAYNGLWKALKIKIQLNKKATDSIIELYKISKDMIVEKTKIWNEVIFHETGKIKSSGVMITGLKEKEENRVDNLRLPINNHGPINQYKIGLWYYYNEKGNLYYKEHILKIKKNGIFTTHI